jgi:hypothetical protein
MYKYASGTSCAAAHVSGAAALIWTFNPFLTHYDVKHILKFTAFDPGGDDYSYFPYHCYDPYQPESPLDSYPSLCGHYYAYNYKKGTGILNVYNALNKATKHGIYSDDMTWSGNILIGGDVTVSEGKTLTIESGSIVYIMKGDYESSGEDTTKVELIVKGTLVVGEPGGDLVSFESYPQSGRTSRDWIGIRLDSTSTGTILSNVTISNAALAIKNVTPIELHNCTIDTSNAASLKLQANTTVESSSIYITCDTQVESGDTLTIAGDSEFYISPLDSNNTLLDSLKVEFEVYGRLVINGDNGDPVEFKSYATNPEPGDWVGIRIIGTNASASLSYCNISHAYHGIKSYNPIQLSNCSIMNSEVHGIFVQGSSANGTEINSCSVNNNGSVGIMISECSNVDVDCVFRRSRTLIPIDCGQAFRAIADVRSDAMRTPSIGA